VAGRVARQMSARGRPPYLAIFAIALAVILLEISHTRVFSFKLYYYFTYFVLGIALLGLGTGGVLVTVVERLRAAALDRLLPACCLAAAAAVAGGYVVVARAGTGSAPASAAPSPCR
jgi:hypothetical protein